MDGSRGFEGACFRRPLEGRHPILYAFRFLRREGLASRLLLLKVPPSLQGTLHDGRSDHDGKQNVPCPCKERHRSAGDVPPFDANRFGGGLPSYAEVGGIGLVHENLVRDEL